MDTRWGFFAFLVVTGGFLVIFELPEATAQQNTAGAESPTVDNISISVDVDRPTDVTSTYEVTVPAETTGNGRWLNGTMWTFPRNPTDNLTVHVNGQRVDPHVLSDARLRHVRVPLGSETGSVIVRIRYTVTPANQALTVPLWVPAVTAGETNQPVFMDVTFPERAQRYDVLFPTADGQDEDGRVTAFRMQWQPGFLSLRYERTEPPVAGAVTSRLTQWVGTVWSGLWNLPPRTRLGSQLFTFALVAIGYLFLSVALVWGVERRRKTAGKEHSTDRESTWKEGDE
jgi:hypothetical protein